MRASPSRKTRWRASRSTSRDDEPQRRVSTGAEWPRPSRRARVLTVALSIVLATLTFAVVSVAWDRAAPPQPLRPRPAAVEVKVITTPSPVPPLPSR